VDEGQSSASLSGRLISGERISDTLSMPEFETKDEGHTDEFLSLVGFQRRAQMILSGTLKWMRGIKYALRKLYAIVLHGSYTR
jgi:hypothetical protein